MKIYFVTHATSTDNEAGLASGWHDCALSPTGIQQAGERIKWFHDIRLDVVFCSDLRRAVQTANIAFGGRIPVVVDRRLREINYGDLNGQPTDIVNPLDMKRIDTPFPNGETYRQAVDRIYDFCRDVRERYTDRSILVIGHRVTRFGLETVTGTRSLEVCLQVGHVWQPFWSFET